jgi:hypothetical protein
MRLKHEVMVYNDPYRKSWPNCQGRLNIEISPNHLLTRLIERIRSAQTKRLENGRVVSIICAGPDF